MAISRFKTWQAYEFAFDLASLIFEVSKRFPKNETYKLADQIIRSSRSVCANLAECYGRRAFKNHYHAKLTDCISENFETQVWLAFALDCNYLGEEEYNDLLTTSEKVGKLLSYMQRNPAQFISDRSKRG
ncbi:MAG: four helix bundle protein [Bacteroidota bacterium]